jgi:ssDNA-binding Zn-finger/Zn-ribbon topoisomerase 1
MSMAMLKKLIHCPNCGYDGKSKIQGTGGLPALFGLISVIIGVYFWPLIIVGIILFFVAVFRPANHVCPTCNWSHPAVTKDIVKTCPACGRKNRLEDYNCISCGAAI